MRLSSVRHAIFLLIGTLPQPFEQIFIVILLKRSVGCGSYHPPPANLDIRALQRPINQVFEKLTLKQFHKMYHYEYRAFWDNILIFGL